MLFYYNFVIWANIQTANCLISINITPVEVP